MQSAIVVFALALLPQTPTFVLCNDSVVNSTNVATGDHDADSTGLLGKYEDVTESSQNTDYLLNYSGDTRDVFEGSGDVDATDNVTATDRAPSVDACVESGRMKICSGRGQCVDGACKCDGGAPPEPTYGYSGTYCEECRYCRAQRCDMFLPCVVCRVVERGASCPSCPASFAEVGAVIKNATNDDKLCHAEYVPGCYITFKYFYTGKEVHLVSEKEGECFHSGAYIFYIYWAFIFLLILMIAATPRLCFLINEKKELKADWNALTLRRRFLYSEIRNAEMETQL